MQEFHDFLCMVAAAPWDLACGSSLLNSSYVALVSGHYSKRKNYTRSSWHKTKGKDERTFSICNTRETHFCLISAITDVSDATEDGLQALLLATRGARNHNLQVVITHASHVCSQHEPAFVWISTKNEWNVHNAIYHARLDLLSLVIWSRVFWPSVTWNLPKAQHWSKSVLTFDRCRPHSVTFGHY